MKKEIKELLKQKPTTHCNDCGCEFNSKNEEVQKAIITSTISKMANTNLCVWCFDLR